MLATTRLVGRRGGVQTGGASGLRGRALAVGGDGGRGGGRCLCAGAEVVEGVERVHQVLPHLARAGCKAGLAIESRAGH